MDLLDFLWTIYQVVGQQGGLLLYVVLTSKRLVNPLNNFMTEQTCCVNKEQAEGHVGKQPFVERLVIDLEHCQEDDPNCIPNHRFGVIGELLCHEEQWEMLILAVIEELD